jgi:hypothetical protein
MNVFELRAAVGACQETRASSRMATPKRPLKYLNDSGRWEVVRPNVDRFALDHEVVRRNPEKFTLVWNRFTAAGREAARLERELATVERQMATAPSATKPAKPATPTPVFGPTRRRASHHIRRRTRAAAWRI